MTGTTDPAEGDAAGTLVAEPREQRAGRTRGRLRVVPTPDREPGRDLGQVRERDDDPWLKPRPGPESQGTLALTFVLPSGLPTEPVAPTLRLVPTAPTHVRPVPVLEDDDFGPRRTPRSELPDPLLWAPRFVQAVVDVLAGDRPTQQLLRWTTDDVYAQVRAMARRQGRPVTGRQRAGRRAAVRSSRVFEPADGVVEACATVRCLDRVRTVAFRLEGTDGRWRCTVLQFG